MENMFPTLLERDDIKEDVAKWIQFTMNEINKYKNKLANMTLQPNLVKNWQLSFQKK